MDNLSLLKEKNCQVYVTYYDNSQIKKYNLKEYDNMHLFDVNKQSKLFNINNVNCHYSELVLAYYIWKNNIKSDYVCIWGHRRSIVPINFDELDKEKIQAYDAFYTPFTPFEYMIRDGINEYIIWSFIKYMIEIKHIDHDLIIDKMFNHPWEDKVWVYSIFNCNWKVLNNVCGFIFDFVNYMIPNGKYNDYNIISAFIKDMQTSFNVVEDKYKNDFLFTDFGRVKSGDRVIGNIFELILPIYLDLCGNGYYKAKNNKKIGTEIIIDKQTDKEIYNIVDTWIAKNTFTGCRQFYIKTNNINKLCNIIDNRRWNLCSGTINVVNDFKDKNIFIINNNEYIDNEFQMDDLFYNNVKLIK